MQDYSPLQVLLGSVKNNMLSAINYCVIHIFNHDPLLYLIIMSFI